MIRPYGYGGHRRYTPGPGDGPVHTAYRANSGECIRRHYSPLPWASTIYPRPGRRTRTRATDRCTRPTDRCTRCIGRIAANAFAGMIRPYGYGGHRRYTPARATDTHPGDGHRTRPTDRCTRCIGRIAANAFAGMIRPYGYGGHRRYTPTRPTDTHPADIPPARPTDTHSTDGHAPDRRTVAHVGRIAANAFAGMIRPYFTLPTS